MNQKYLFNYLVTIGMVISFVLFILSFSVDVQALTMSNSQYNIQSEVNPFGGKATGTAGTVTFSSDRSPGAPFIFSISTTDINFGRLVPGEPVTRENTLTVSNRSATGYQVTLEENHPLRMSSTNADILDTTCDAGNCSYTTAAVWTSPLTYGFGYRCDNVSGSDCSPSFATTNFYKQFASDEAGESAQVVMSSTRISRKKQAKITYKVNIPATQDVGIYQNIIRYIATPSI